MSVLEFIAALVQALGWPAAAVILALLFRKQLGALLTGPLRRMKAGPFELEWDRVLSRTEIALDKPTDPEVIAAAPSPISEELSSVAAQAPTAVIIEAFARVERELREILRAANTPAAVSAIGAVRLARLAGQEELVSRETVTAIEGMSVLRNLAAHGAADEVDEAKARDYLALADAVLFALRAAKDKIPPPTMKPDGSSM